jgi:hypothetical protein
MAYGVSPCDTEHGESHPKDLDSGNHNNPEDPLSSTLSSSALRKLSGLEEARRKWDHVRAMVSQAASGPRGQPDLALMGRIGRAAADVGRVLADNGFGALSHSVAEINQVARRGGSPHAKIRTMREITAAVRTGIEQAERAVNAEERQASQA